MQITRILSLSFEMKQNKNIIQIILFTNMIEKLNKEVNERMHSVFHNRKLGVKKFLLLFNTYIMIKYK